MSISLTHVSKHYGSQKAVDDISFTLHPNQITGFLGPNGAGKSTTMKMITGYLESDGGQISVCGKPVSTQSINSRKKIGYLPESNPLYMEMYIKEYLTFIADIHQLQDISKRTEEVIEITGLRPESHKKIGQLSKGYKQRVGLAAALIHDPEVLILDEPTTGLDPNQIVEIREVIRKLGSQKTILFSSHIMQEVESVCERVIIIHKGKIVADDTVENLRKMTAGKQQLVVRFKEKTDIALLSSTGLTKSVTEQSGNTFILETDEPDTLKKRVLEISLHHHLNITELTGNNPSLESIFKSLTT